MRYCSTCGYKVEGEFKFCPECGASLAMSSPVPPGQIGNPVNTPGGGNPSGTMPGMTPPLPGNVFGFGMMGMGSMPGTDRPNGADKEYDPNEWFFSYDTSGMMFRSGCTYKAWKEDGKAMVQVRRFGMDLKDAPVFDTDISFLDRIEESLKLAEADAWDGFSGHADNVMDGESFTFSFKDGAGRVIRAHGYMSWPKNFGVASRIWTELFDGLYEEHFPDYYKRLRKYLEEEVAAKLPRSKAGNSKVPIVGYGSKHQYHFGEWSIPEGVLKISVSDYISADPDVKREHPSAEGVLLSVAKRRSEEYPEEHETFFKVGLYRMDANGPELLYEWEPVDDVISGANGECSVFLRRTPDGYGTNICFYRQKSYVFGNTYKHAMLSVLSYVDGAWQQTDAAEARIPAGESEYSAEDIEKMALLAERLGLKERADRWRADHTGIYLTYADKSDFVLVRWSSTVDAEFGKKVDAAPDGTVFDEYEIKVETAVY